jgi:hypothetical protein
LDNELNIFSLSTSTPEDSLVHGAALARAWVAGEMRSDDQLDLSAEFDAQCSAQLGGEVSGGLAKFTADLTGAAHAGIRLQAGIPLDLFEGAGIIARLRLEASVNGQAQVTAAMSLAELHQLLIDPLPQAARPYVRILLHEVDVGATVWGRLSFAAMAVAELMAVVTLFPTDGSPPGVTAKFNYGFAWGYGGAWGVIANFGFDPKELLRKLSDQAAADLAKEIDAYRKQAHITDGSPLSYALDAAEIIAPLTLSALVTWCQREISRDDTDQHASLLDAMLGTLKRLIVNALIPRLLDTTMKAIASQLGGAGREKLLQVWASLVRAVSELANSSADSDLEPVGAVAELILATAQLLPADSATIVKRTVRAASALIVLISDGTSDAPSLRKVLMMPGGAGLSLAGQAEQVLASELAGTLADLGILPGWLEDLVGDAAELVALLTDDQDPATRHREACQLLTQVLGSITQELATAGVWDHLATVLPVDLVRAIRAEVKILTELSTTLGRDGAVDAHHTREAVSAGIMILIGRPLNDMIKIIANRGLTAVPPALRTLADQVDDSPDRVNINASWGQLARQVVGATAGFPVAQLLRHVAQTTDTWTQTVLPEELQMLDKYLLAEDLADQVLEVGTGPAIAAFKQKLLPALGQHVIDHTLASLKLALTDSVNLFTSITEGSAKELLRILELTAITSFRLAELAIDTAEAELSELQAREQELEGQVAQYTADFFQGVASLAAEISSLDTHVGTALTNWLIQQCLGPAAANIPSYLRDVLDAIVTAAVNAATGGLLPATAAVVRSLGDVLRASADALRITAETEEGSAVGIWPLVESLFRGDQVPSVHIPIGVDLPNPVIPFVLPNIHIDIATVDVPANVVADVIMTLLFGAAGIEPLVDTLNGTVDSLRATKAALDTVKRAIAGNDASEMRSAMATSGASADLNVRIVQPSPASVAPAVGTILFQLTGANATFVAPQAAGLPSEAISRVRVLVNGQQVPLSQVGWHGSKGYLEGRLSYQVQRVGSKAGSGITLSPGPAAVVVLIVDGKGKTSAQASWHFVVERPPGGYMTRPWFPIATKQPHIDLRSLLPILIAHQPVPVTVAGRRGKPGKAVLSNARRSKEV